MRRVFLILPRLAVCATLAGCATGPSLQTRMTAYIGAPEQTLVQALGVPDKQITVNGVQYLAYVRSAAQVAPNAADFGFAPWGGPYWGGPFYGGGFGVGLPQNIEVWSCETIFSVKAGRVWDVAFKGNDCD